MRPVTEEQLRNTGINIFNIVINIINLITMVTCILHKIKILKLKYFWQMNNYNWYLHLSLPFISKPYGC